MSLIKDRELEAHSHAGRVPFPTQTEAGNPGLRITQAEQRREELDVTALCRRISGGKEEGAIEEDEVNDVGNTTLVQGTVPVTSSVKGPIPVTSAIVRKQGREEGKSQEGVTPDVTMPQAVGEEEAIAGSRASNPTTTTKVERPLRIGRFRFLHEAVRETYLKVFACRGVLSRKRWYVLRTYIRWGRYQCNLRFCEPSISVEPSKLWDCKPG